MMKVVGFFHAKCMLWILIVEKDAVENEIHVINDALINN